MKTDLQLFAEETLSSVSADTDTGENAAPEAGNAPAESDEVGDTRETPETEDTQRAEEGSGKADSTADALRALENTFEVFRRSAEADEVIRAWEKDAADVKDSYPDFDLRSQLRDPDFAALIKAGVPLRRAYETVNLDRIITSAMRFAAVNAGKKAAEAVCRHNSRPQENSVLDRASSVKQTDVRSLTEKDIMRIIGEVSRGAKITFK